MKKISTFLFATAITCLSFFPVFAQQNAQPASINQFIDQSFNPSANPSSDLPVILVSDLPENARKTIQLIRQKGPFPFEKDGTVFGNYERILPKQKRGYYHEYTVPGRGLRSRGAQRIVVGGEPQNDEFYYTADHYMTFGRIQFPER